MEGIAAFLETEPEEEESPEEGEVTHVPEEEEEETPPEAQQNNVAHYRREAGLSQRELAEEVGRSKMFVCHLEIAGSDAAEDGPRLADVLRFSDALGVPPSKLWDGLERREPSLKVPTKQGGGQ